MTKSLCK